MHVCMRHVCMYVCLCMHVHVYVCILGFRVIYGLSVSVSLCISILRLFVSLDRWRGGLFSDVCMHVCMRHVCMYVSVYVCIYMCMYVY